MINTLQHRYDNSLSFDQKKSIIRTIFNTKRYTFHESKKRIDKKIAYWSRLHKLNLLRKNRIRKYILNSKDDTVKAYSSIINSHDSTNISRKIYNKKNININNEIFIHYLKFSNIYKDTLLNTINIQSSLNNFFAKFYNIPNISNYHNIKKYFKHYKIRTKKLVYHKQIIKHSKSIVFNKNYTNNLVVDLSEFLNMYGFR
jgi:hypothetical protein